MKKTRFLILFLFACQFLQAQGPAFDPKITLKWAPLGLLLGNISLQGEYTFGVKSSLTAKIGVPIKKMYQVIYDNNDADISMKAFAFLAGYRKYLSKQKLKGIYIEPYFKYVHHTSEGLGRGMLDGVPVTMNISNDYNATGVGAQLGVQFLIKKRIVLDIFFLGPEINTATNNFKAIDISNSSGWNTLQASEAEQDIKTFLDEFPFIRKKVDVLIDKPNKTVRADFKGALPGIRTGFSIGIAL